MENKANKSTEVIYITADQAADIYLKLQSYIAEELNNLERMLLEEINQTLQNWLENNEIQKYLDIIQDTPIEPPINQKVYLDESHNTMDVQA